MKPVFKALFSTLLVVVGASQSAAGDKSKLKSNWTPLSASREVDMACPDRSGAGSVIAQMELLFYDNDWTFQYAAWLKNRPRVPGQSDGNRFFNRPTDNGWWFKSLDHKTAFILDQTRDEAFGERLLRQMFFGYGLIEIVGTEGFEILNGERGLPSEYRLPACTFARSFLLEALQVSPLMVADSVAEMKTILSRVERSLPKSAAWRAESRADARRIWDGIPKMAAGWFLSQLRYYAYLRNLAAGNVPAFAADIPKLFREMCAADLAQTDATLHTDHYFFARTFSELGALAGPVSSGELSKEMEDWNRKLEWNVAQLEYTTDPRISQTDETFVELFNRDYKRPEGSLAVSRYPMSEWQSSLFETSRWRERNLDKEDLGRLRAENRKYEILLTTFVEGNHPLALKYLVEMGTLIWSRFPDWVRRGLAARPPASKGPPKDLNSANLCDGSSDRIQAWLCPKRMALEAIRQDMEAFSDAELQTLVGWSSKQIFSIRERCSIDCAPATYLSRVVDEFAQTYADLGAQAQAYLASRKSLGPGAPEYRLPNTRKIPGIVNRAGAAWRTELYQSPQVYSTIGVYIPDPTQRTWVVMGGTLGMRLGRYIQDHWKRDLLVGGGTLIAIAFLPVSVGVGIMYAGIGVAVLSSTVMLGQIGVGMANPRSRLALTGVQAVDQGFLALTTIAWVAPIFSYGSMTNQVQGMKNFGALAARPFQEINDLRAAYQTLNLRNLRITEEDVTSAYKAAAFLAHPDRIGGDGAKMVAVNMARNTVLTGLQKFPILNRKASLHSFFQTLANFRRMATSDGFVKTKPLLSPRPELRFEPAQ